MRRDAEVSVSDVPRGLTIDAIEPGRVHVTLAGRREDAVLPVAEPRVRLDGLQMRLGQHTVELSRADVEVPPAVEVVSVDPPRVRVSVRTSRPGETE